MILLTSTSDLLRVVSSSTANLSVHADWIDAASGAGTPGRQNTAISTATTTTVVASPGSGVQRNVKNVSIRNDHASTANAVTVLHTDGTTSVNLIKVTLAAGEQLQHNDAGWQVIDVLGNIKTAQAVAAAGTDKTVQFNDGGVVGADAGLTFDKATDTLALPNASSTIDIGVSGSTTPSAPASGLLTVFGRTVAGRQLLAQIGPSGLNYSFQPFLARNKIGYWCPPGNATTVPGVFGITALTAQGTATARTVATTSLATRMRRIGYPSSATAGTFAGARMNVAQFSCGSGSPDGSGVFIVERWVESDPAPVSGRRAFHGLTATTGAFTNVEVNTLTNLVGICQLSSDATQWYSIAAGSSAQSAVALGTSVGAPGGNSTTAWELAIFAPNGVANTYYCQLTNITTGAVVTWTVTGNSTQCPQSSTLLAYNMWATNNATAAAVGIDICSLYVETDS